MALHGSITHYVTLYTNTKNVSAWIVWRTNGIPEKNVKIMSQLNLGAIFLFSFIFHKYARHSIQSQETENLLRRS